MAKNWKCSEAVRAIQAGNKEDILDIGRRFPLFANLAAKVNEAGMELLDCVPDYCTARKIESVLKTGVVESDETEEEVEAEEPKEKEAPKKKAAPKKAAPKKEEAEEGLEGKSAKELYEMCKEAGLKVKPKQDKAVYIAALQPKEEEEEAWDEEEEPAPKKAKEKPAKKAAKKEEAEDEDDDWDI